MTPPYLSADTPISETIHPSKPFVLIIRGNQNQFSVFDHIDHSLFDVLTIDIPLRFDHRFNNILASGTQSKSHLIWCLVSVKTQLFHVLLHLTTTIKSHHTSILSTILIDFTIFIKNLNEFQLLSLSTLIIIRIMSWCDFNCTCTKSHIDQLIISNNLNHSIAEWVDQLLSNQVSISFIL